MFCLAYNEEQHICVTNTEGIVNDERCRETCKATTRSTLGCPKAKRFRGPGHSPNCSDATKLLGGVVYLNAKKVIFCNFRYLDFKWGKMEENGFGVGGSFENTGLSYYFLLHFIFSSVCTAQMENSFTFCLENSIISELGWVSPPEIQQF